MNTEKLLFLVLFGAVNLMGQDVSEIDAFKNFQLLIARGDSLLKTKERHLALTIYEEALKLSETNKQSQQVALSHKKIGNYYYFTKEYQNAENHYRSGLNFNPDPRTNAEHYYNIYLVKRKLKQNDSVLYYLKRSLKNYERFEGDASTFQAYLKGGLEFKDRQYFDYATRYLVLAYEGFLKLKDSVNLAKVCTSLGNVHNRLKNYTLAINYQREALKLLEQNEQSTTIGVSHANLGKTFKNVRQYDSAIAHFKRAIEIVPISHKTYGITLNNLASAYMAKGQMRLAEKNAKASLVAKQKLKDTSSILYTHNTIAELYLENNQPKKAKAHLDILAAQIHKTTDQVVELDYFKNRKTYYKVMGDYKTALTFHEKYLEVFEKIYDTEQTQIVQTLQAQFEAAKKENEILKLSVNNKNNLLLLVEKDKELKQRNFFIGLLTLGILLSFIVYYLFAQKQKAARQHLKLERLDAVHKGQDNLKRRIARDLHDVVANSYSGLRLKVLALANMKEPKKLALEVAQNLDQIDEQVRGLSYRLSPLATHIKGSSFTEILEARLSEFQLYHKVRVNLECPFSKKMDQFNYEIQDTLYAVIMETLTNVSKYAKATILTISFTQDKKGWMHFSFEDNGIGIDENYKTGTGLMNIAQRMEVLGGSSSIARTNTGTEVTISFPTNS